MEQDKTEKLLTTEELLTEKIAGICYHHRLDTEEWESVEELSIQELNETTIAAATSGYLGGLQGIEYLARASTLVARIELLREVVGHINSARADPSYFET